MDYVFVTDHELQEVLEPGSGCSDLEMDLAGALLRLRERAARVVFKAKVEYDRACEESGSPAGPNECWSEVERLVEELLGDIKFDGFPRPCDNPEGR